MWFWLFILSTLLNALLLLYIRWLLKVVATINEDVDNISQLLRDFSLHLSSVHDMEIFYGDETLTALIKHASELSEKLTNVDLILNEENEIAEEETKED